MSEEYHGPSGPNFNFIPNTVFGVDPFKDDTSAEDISTKGEVKKDGEGATNSKRDSYCKGLSETSRFPQAFFNEMNRCQKRKSSIINSI